MHASPQKTLKLRKLPPSYSAVVMPFVLSILMTCIISAVSTAIGTGWTNGFVATWSYAWGVSSLVAFPSLLIVLPIVRRIVAAIVDQPARP
ncbi:DUF2798 domain-containing protein [Mesorhizobium temperatum]|uniref:DUF2798 domain-containing protein n=1 Tax=Mesorhizobium temperatum TaxID=241416 RepID=A0A271LTN9_9HYPH|nr:DUF2798 domain-containing protein [Mesorhizobium temperatum]PAQ10690.1 hypothetical protein CIT26_07750 [Mesorhizobium temperatum]